MEWLSIWSNLALLDSYFGYTSASMRENAPFPDLVAKVVLKAVTSENPGLRYLAGKDVETWMEAKRSMSDEGFYKMMKQTLMK